MPINLTKFTSHLINFLKNVYNYQTINLFRCVDGQQAEMLRPRIKSMSTGACNSMTGCYRHLVVSAFSDSPIVKPQQVKNVIQELSLHFRMM